MEVSLNQAFQDSQMAVDNYFAYISRQNDEQKEQVNDLSHSLNSVIEGINTTGAVAAMAAKESMQSHNTIFGMLKAMNTEQGLLTQMLVEIKRNGGSESAGGSVLGEALGGGVESVAMVGAMNEILTALGMTTLPEFVLPAMVLLGGLKGATDQDDQNLKNLGEQTHPNSLTNKALEASAEAERFINGTYYSINPAPNPLMNGPGMLLGGLSRRDLPAAKTFGEAMAVVAAINEANDYLEATGQIPTRPQHLHEDFSMTYNNITPYGGVIEEFYKRGGVDGMQPQSVQTITEYELIKNMPEQTINFNIANDFKGNSQERRDIIELSESLARQIMDKLNSGAMLYSNNW